MQKATSNSTHASSQQLSDEVLRLTDEVRVLRDAIDELREELTYAVRNCRLIIPLDELSRLSPPTQSTTESETTLRDGLVEEPKSSSPRPSGMLF